MRHFLHQSIALPVFVRAPLSLTKTLLLALFGTMLAFAQPAHPALTNNDVIKMVQTGLSQDIIIKVIAESPANFDLTPNGLTVLEQGKVPDAVFKAMAARQMGQPIPGYSSQPAGSDNQSRVPVPGQPGVYKVEERPSAVPPPASAPTVRTQVHPSADLFFGYSYLNVDLKENLTGISRQSGNGWNTSVSVNANGWFAIEGDVAGYYKSISIVNFHDYFFTGGPRINIHQAFVHALFGVDRVSVGADGISYTDSGFTTILGGGVQLTIPNSHWAVRPSFDYVLTRHNLHDLIPTTNLNDFRASVGLVYLIGESSRASR